MTEIDWGALVRLVPEVAIVLIFVWFSLERDKRAELAQSLRQTARMVHEAEQSKMWRDFLSEERQWRAAASKEVAEELKSLTTVVANTNALLIAHDTSTKIMASQRRQEYAETEPKP